MSSSGVSGRSFFRLVFLQACLLILSIADASAQLSSATLNGVARDSTGAVIKNASVVLRNVGTSFERVTASNDTGNYVFSDVTPGPYTLKMSAQSFATKQVSEFVLAVNQTATIDLTLSAGSDSEVLTVTATGEQLQSSTAELGTVIATKQVNDLPLNGRNFTQLLSLTPGVAPISVSQNNNGNFTTAIANGSAFEFPAINGSTNRSNYFLTDGLTNFGAFLSTYAVPPIIDAIQEFKVVSHADSAEFGSVLGGVVNVVTKSGTDQFHGSGWEYIRNDAFDARDPFLAPSAKKPSFRQNQFGASVGGPVEIPRLYNGKKKTFFFFAYQGFRYSQPASNNLLVPTAAQLSGDFSALCQTGFTAGICNDRDSDGNVIDQIYNPFTTMVDNTKTSGFSRQPFTGNIVPSNLIDSRLVGFAQAIFPTAGNYNAAINSNAVDTNPTTQTQNEYNVRIDHNFGQKDSAWFRYSRINSAISESAGLPGLITQNAIPGREWGGSYVHIFSSSLALQAQYARTTVGDSAATRFKNLDSASVSQTAGFSPDFASNFSGTKGWLIPLLGISGFAAGGESVTNTYKATDNHQISGTLTKVKGTHELKFGGGFTTSVFASTISDNVIAFGPEQTSDANGTAGTGFSLASFLMNIPIFASRRNTNEKTRPGGVLSAFAQDFWKATPHLTLNYGLRYDLTLIPPFGTADSIGEQGGIETGDINFKDGTYVLQHVPPPCSVRGAAPCIPDILGQAAGTLPDHVVEDQRGRIAHNTYTNLGPRAGFAYRLGERTVVRGAAGVIYDNWAAVTQMAQNIEGAWPGIGQLISVSLNLPNSSTATANGVPTVTAQNPFAGNGTAGLPAATPFGSGAVTWYYDPNIKNPYSIQYNFGLQRQLNPSTTVSGNYVGAQNHRLDVGGFYNTALTPGPGDPQARALFPYIEPTFYDRSVGAGNYNAFQFELDKRFTNGLAYQVAYTFSKSLDESSGWFGGEGTGIQDPYNPKGSYGPSGFDLTHVLSMNAVYELPIGQGKRFSTGNHVVDYGVGNWQINGILLIRSGQPYTMFYSQDQANTGNIAGYERANLVGDPNSGTCPNEFKVGSTQCAFNTSAFAVPDLYTYGTTGRDQFRTAPYWNFDMSIFRQFPLWSENRHLELRAEAFNLYNTLIYGQPGSDLNNPSDFGKVTYAANAARQLQFGVKIIF